MLGAAQFIVSNSDDQIQAFWGRQVERLERVRSEVGANDSWRAAPREIRHLAKRIHVPLLTRLLGECGMEGSSFAEQFNVGFPLVGEVSYPGVFSAARDVCPPAISIDELVRQGALRWAELDKVLTAEEGDASALWQVCLDERDKGWLSGPFSVGADVVLDTGPVCRFAVYQHGKLRPCDNLRRSHSNAASSVGTPVSLPTVDHLAFLLDAIQGKDGRACAVFKADHANAYRQLPLRPSHARFGLVVARCPSSGEVGVFVPRALLFGSTTAVAHYNALSRAISSIFARVFKIPIVGYFDDFAAPLPATLAQRALGLFRFLNSLLGFDLKPEKCLVGSVVEFLGVEVHARLSPVEVSISNERRFGLLSSVSDALASGSLRRGDAEVLCGKLAFCHCASFSKEGRAFMPRLYNHTRSSVSSISSLLASDLVWWQDYLSSQRRRVFSRRLDAPRWLLYTDAAGDGGLGGGSCLCGKFDPRAHPH